MSQKVLVVEDDNNIAELLRLYLQKDGFEVSHAADGGKAVEMAKEIQPDLVLLDIMLPVTTLLDCGFTDEPPSMKKSASSPSPP